MVKTALPLQGPRVRVRVRVRVSLVRELRSHKPRVAAKKNPKKAHLAVAVTLSTIGGRLGYF